MIGTLSGSLVPRLDKDKKYWQKNRQSSAAVGPRSDILAKDRPPNIERYIGRANLCHGLTNIVMILAEDWLANIGR